MASNVISKGKLVFNHEHSIFTFAKNLILKNPGIFIGNLNYWVKEEFPEATTSEIDLAFLSLARAGYCFTWRNLVYPPHHVDQDEKDLTKFCILTGHEDRDFGILYELNKCGGGSLEPGGIARLIASNGWYDDEFKVKYRIQELCIEKVIIKKSNLFMVNWELIRSVLNENNSD